MKGVVLFIGLLTLSTVIQGEAGEQVLDKWIAATKCAFYYSSSNSSAFSFLYCSAKDYLLKIGRSAIPFIVDKS